MALLFTLQSVLNTTGTIPRGFRVSGIEGDKIAWVWEVHNRVGTIGWLAGEVFDIGRLDQLIFGSDNEIIVVCVRNIRWICDDGGVILDHVPQPCRSQNIDRVGGHAKGVGEVGYRRSIEDRYKRPPSKYGHLPIGVIVR